jgi:CHASE2 domain-containing sensor protein
VLIGVTDPQLSSFINTPFDNEMPGIALHAFALDNLLNTRYYNTSYILLSKIVFAIFVLVLVWIFYSKKFNIYVYGIIFLLFILTAFVLTSLMLN